MYKKQMKIQKIVCFLVLAASVVVFLYSLGIMTDLYDALYFTIPNKDNLERSRVEGARVYYDMQPFNQQFLHFGIILILCAVLLFLTNTNTRRRYYISNIIAVVVNIAMNIYVALWAHSQIIAFKAQFLAISFEDLKKFAERQHTLYTESTFWFDVHIAVFAFAIIANVLLFANLIWKFQLMKAEKQLISAGKGGSRMNEEEYIRKDRMRFTKNSLASTLAILAIVFDVLYFLNIYSSDIHNNVGNFYYQIRIGGSIILNLLFMLAAFLSSEGIKNYKAEYGYVMAFLGVLQVVRIFILPMQAHAAEVTVGGVTSKVMGTGQFITVIIYLILSAVCMFAGAYIGIKRSKELQAHVASLKKAAA